MSKPDSESQKKNVGPFFVLGCVRSGTTMLRDVLRMHPNLAAPEETHFFRPAEPFGSDGYSRFILNNAVLKTHRQLDGISEEEFASMLKLATSRGDLTQRYMTLFMQRRKPEAARWFDKTPQNVYGAAMIAVSLPRAKFVHIVRNPINVCASLRIGKVMKVNQLIGAVNYWREATAIMGTLKRAYPGRVFEFRYEDFMTNSDQKLQELLAFLDEPYQADWFTDFVPRASDHEFEGILNAKEMDLIKRLCGPGLKQYGYESTIAESAS